jgi:membrane associated rhomboid family serine protease
MDTFLKIRIVAGGLAFGSGVACAVRIYRRPGAANRQLPVTSILLIGITALITGLQFFFPEILSALRRDPEGLRTGEWWRMVTPLFVQAEGWPQCLANGIAALLFCPLGEKLYGKRMLALYFIAGVTGEIVGYIQNSHGAGSSVGICGVMGGLFGFACARRGEGFGHLIVPAIVGLCGAIILSLCGDRHGPPILVGAVLAGMMQPRIVSVPDKTQEKDVSVSEMTADGS